MIFCFDFFWWKQNSVAQIHIKNLSNTHRIHYSFTLLQFEFKWLTCQPSFNQSVVLQFFHFLILEFPLVCCFLLLNSIIHTYSMRECEKGREVVATHKKISFLLFLYIFVLYFFFFFLMEIMWRFVKRI